MEKKTILSVSLTKSRWSSGLNRTLITLRETRNLHSSKRKRKRRKWRKIWLYSAKRNRTRSSTRPSSKLFRRRRKRPLKKLKKMAVSKTLRKNLRTQTIGHQWMRTSNSSRKRL